MFWIVEAVIFLGVFTQSLAGFGVSLVAMALLPEVIGIQMATPLVALVALTLEITLLLRYRQSMSLRSIWPLVLASIVGVPLGILAVHYLDENLVLTGLGIVLVGYGAYSLFDARPPALTHRMWTFTAGFLGGFLGGAYNTSGPPVIIYSSAQSWQPAEFKGNLQGFFFLNSLMVVSGHLLSRNVTPQVWQQYLLALPVIALGFLAGSRLDRVLKPALFRKLVFGLLILMGIRMIL